MMLVSDVTGERREGQPAAPAETRAADTEVRSNEALADLTNSSLIENSAHRQFHIFPGQGQSCSLLLSFSQPAFIQWVRAGCIFTVCCSNLQRFYRISINIVGLEGGNISPSF